MFTTLYCLFGLALIALVIDVAQDHAKAKTKWIREGQNDEMTR